MIIKYFSLTILFVILLASCKDSGSKNAILLEKYPLPNIDSLVKNQVEVLSGKTILKKIIFNGKEEILSLETDTTFWKSELSVFSNLEINKPSLIGAYYKSRINNKIIFERKTGEQKGAILVTTIISPNGNLLDISGIVQDKNYLYSSEQVLSMTFSENSQTLKSYNFSGYQKMIAKDTVFFEIDGKVK